MGRIREIALPWRQQPQCAVRPNPVFSSGAIWLPGVQANLCSGIVNPLASGTGLAAGVGVRGRADVLQGGVGPSFGYGATLPSTQAISFVLVADQVSASDARLLGNASYEILPAYGKLDCYANGGLYSVAIGNAVSWSGALVYTHDMTDSANYPMAWLDGVPLTVTRTTSSSTSPIGGTTVLCNHAQSPGVARQFVGSVYLGGIFPLSFAGDVAQAISANPWQLFAPRVRRIWVPSAGGSAAPDIAFVGAENITATSADYRVTLDFA